MQEVKRHKTFRRNIPKDSIDIAYKFRLSSLNISIRDVTCMQKIIKLWSFLWDKHCLDIQQYRWLSAILLYLQQVSSLVNVKKEQVDDYYFCSMLRLK